MRNKLILVALAVMFLTCLPLLYLVYSCDSDSPTGLEFVIGTCSPQIYVPNSDAWMEELSIDLENLEEWRKVWKDDK